MEECTGAEKAGVELASKVDRISYTGKMRLEMSHQLWLIKTFFYYLKQNKMTARAVHTKNHMKREKEKTLKGLYRYCSYVQLNM